MREEGSAAGAQQLFFEGLLEGVCRVRLHLDLQAHLPDNQGADLERLNLRQGSAPARTLQLPFTWTRRPTQLEQVIAQQPERDAAQVAAQVKGAARQG